MFPAYSHRSLMWASLVAWYNRHGHPLSRGCRHNEKEYLENVYPCAIHAFHDGVGCYSGCTRLVMEGVTCPQQ